MPILNRASEMHEEIVGWRRHLHQNPELGFDLADTSAFVADRLRAFGCDEVVTGIGRTGVVGVIRGRHGAGRTVGLRADMDALPLDERSGVSHASHTAGRMHACGHDGHTAMLLGAAKYLAETRNFAGSVVVVFQPAEEIGGGAREMLAEGLMERFGIERIYGMHNMPGIPLGHFAICDGPIMGAPAKFSITISGRGGHAARPHTTIDPILAGAQLVTALQTIVSRRTDPLASVVVTITKVDAGTAYNIIPEKIELWGTVRALRMADAEAGKEQVTAVCAGVAAATGAKIEIDYEGPYPSTVNPPQEARFSAQVAQEVVGADRVDANVKPSMAGEDFARMLAARPGSFIFIGNGDSAELHHPAYDFADEAIPAGVSYWVRLTETALAPR
ncbi:M20 aminoacylase family protein [Aquamicrobium sp. LC103]|uniref:M20 aminoacylase family protein n=1 Tax=Aquamicrobium sp. LC103 TaxID=1120658 RepID=UPI00063EAF58|nr:M20 aminoacylase family protein [Aquamicrobium sp. LC103]TKT75433.1 amidohydrolase [Aquamicrobium sp. LC103]